MLYYERGIDLIRSVFNFRKYYSDQFQSAQKGLEKEERERLFKEQLRNTCKIEVEGTRLY